MYIFIKSAESLSDLAESITQVLAEVDLVFDWQLREGENFGGLYCRLDGETGRMYLVKNKGEVDIPGREEYTHYLVVQLTPDQRGDLTDRVVEALAAAGTVIEKDSSLP